MSVGDQIGSAIAAIMPAGVSVIAPARLHMGFLDLSGSLGRMFAGVGLTLDGIQVRLTARLADHIRVQGVQPERARYYVQRFLDAVGSTATVHVDIAEAIPPHIGLGSGTQLALAVGVALNQLLGLTLSVREIAALHARGQRSGIGIGAFVEGGFVVDGGRGTTDGSPPVIMRMAFPEAWRVLIILDEAGEGLHGDAEVAAFQGLPPLSVEASAQLCHMMMMQIAPALAEADFAPFARGIGQLQRVIGDHFAPAQGGRFASPRVTQALQWLEAQGVCGVGQSSWGPTGFALLESAADAQYLQSRLSQDWVGRGVGFRVLQGRNLGGTVVRRL